MRPKNSELALRALWLALMVGETHVSKRVRDEVLVSRSIDFRHRALLQPDHRVSARYEGCAAHSNEQALEGGRGGARNADLRSEKQGRRPLRAIQKVTEGIQDCSLTTADPKKCARRKRASDPCEPTWRRMGRPVMSSLPTPIVNPIIARRPTRSCGQRWDEEEMTWGVSGQTGHAPEAKRQRRASHGTCNALAAPKKLTGVVEPPIRRLQEFCFPQVRTSGKGLKPKMPSEASMPSTVWRLSSLSAARVTPAEF